MFQYIVHSLYLYTHMHDTDAPTRYFSLPLTSKNNEKINEFHLSWNFCSPTNKCILTPVNILKFIECYVSHPKQFFLSLLRVEN